MNLGGGQSPVVAIYGKHGKLVAEYVHESLQTMEDQRLSISCHGEQPRKLRSLAKKKKKTLICVKMSSVDLLTGRTIEVTT